MYLTQMQLDLNNHRTLAALDAPSKFHGAIESAFEGARRRNLWRIDRRNGQAYLLLLSSEQPDLGQAAEQFAPPGGSWTTRDYAPLLEQVQTGSHWRFRLCANPTYSTPAGPGQRGRVCAHSTPKHQMLWLVKQGEKHGFTLSLDQFAVTKSVWYRFKKGNTGKTVTFLSVTYDGLLKVCDAARFRAALCGGIGSGKAYGAGLMTLVRAGADHG